MKNEELSNYIQQARESGILEEQIRRGLLQDGWSEIDVDEVLSAKASVVENQKILPKPKVEISKAVTLILIIGVILVGVGYFASAYYLTLWPFAVEMAAPQVAGEAPTPTVAPSPRPATKKYTPDDLGFIITTPDGWENKTIESSEADLRVAFKYQSPDKKRSFVVSVFSDKDPEKMTLAQWAQQDSTNYDSQAKQDETSVRVGKNLGSIYIGEINGRIYKRLYLIRGVLKEIYRITVEIDKNNSWMSEFDQIITTLSFFEPKTDTNITYRNLQFSFEITHPSTWRARQESDSVRLRNYYTPILDLPIDPVDITIDYLKDENPNKLPIQEWLEVGSNKIFISNEKSRQNISLGDEAIRSVRDTYSKTPGKSIISYLIGNGKDIVQVTYIAMDNASYVQNPDKIVETLKFIPFDQNAYSELLTEEAQKIIGEDKNTNGVWDYIEDYINQKYAYSEKIKAGLNQYIKTFQQALIENRDKQESIKNANASFRASDCLTYILSNGAESSESIEEAFNIVSDVRAQLLNTDARSRAYINYNGQLGGIFEENGDPNHGCDFNPDILPN